MRRRTFLAAMAPVDHTAGLPDFSNCGYRGGGVELPEVALKITLKPAPGDATARIQAAIDDLARLPRRDRGAIELARGEYAIGGTLRIHASGIVLRGEGTRLIATGTKARAVIVVGGPSAGTVGTGVAIADEVVPVGAWRLRVSDASGLKRGQLVIVRRQGNAEWIKEIGMDRIKPRPQDPQSTKQWEPFALDFERVITAVEGDAITLDAPVFCAIERRWGGGLVLPFDDSARVEECGVENLAGVSAFDRTVTADYKGEKYFSDEAHAADLIQIDAARNCWVRGVSARYFAVSLVNVKRARQVTVEDCDNAEMVSQITGSRRYPYYISQGQRVLVRRVKSESGRHDFVVGSRVAGPNVFLECTAGRAFATSEPHHRWSVGGLYDNVKANLAIQDRQYMGTGHGWAGANYVVWNCEGTIVSQKPPTAENWVVGHVGQREPGAFAPRPEAKWVSFGQHVEPRSLYRHQLEARLGRRAR